MHSGSASGRPQSHSTSGGLRLLLGVLIVAAIGLVNHNRAAVPASFGLSNKTVRRMSSTPLWGNEHRLDFQFVVVPLSNVEPQLAGDALSIIAHTIGQGSSTRDELKDICLIEQYSSNTDLQDILGANCAHPSDRTRLADGEQECTVPCGKMYASLANKAAVVEFDFEVTERLLKYLNVPAVRLHRRELLPTLLQSTADIEASKDDANISNTNEKLKEVLRMYGDVVQAELSLRSSLSTIPSVPLFVEDVLDEHPVHWCKRLGRDHGCDGVGNTSTTMFPHRQPSTSLQITPLQNLVANPQAWCIALSHTLYFHRSHPDCMSILEHPIRSHHLPIPTVLPTRLEDQIPLLTDWSRDPFLRKCTLPGKIRETDPLGTFIIPVTSPRLRSYASRWIGIAGYGYCGNNMFWCEIEGEQHPALAFTETFLACPLPDKFHDLQTVRMQVATSGGEFSKYVTNLIHIYHGYQHLTVPYEHQRHHRLLVCTMIKNEDDNIDEWLRHHIQLGVDHFALYVNLDAIPVAFRIQLKEYVQLGYVTLHQWSHWFSQTQALNDCTQRYRSYTDWMTFIDVDEFYFEGYNNDQPTFDIVDRIHNITTSLGHICAYIQELVYCKKDALARTDLPISENFPHRMKYMTQHKPIFQPNATIGVHAYGPHFVVMIKPNKDTLNQQCPIIRDGSGLVLKHFRFKSLEEFVSRRQGPDSVFYHEYTADKLRAMWYEANKDCEA